MLDRDAGSVHHEIAEPNPTLETFEVHSPDHSRCIAMLRFDCDMVFNFLDGSILDIVRVERRIGYIQDSGLRNHCCAFLLQKIVVECR